MARAEASRFESRLLINGQLVQAANRATYDNVNPATGQSIGKAADAGPKDADAAVTAARNAFDVSDWQHDHAFRHSCLKELQAALSDNVEAFRNLQILEAGHTQSTAATVGGVIDGMSFMVEQANSYRFEEEFGQKAVNGSEQLRALRKEPFGVVVLITPWNAPFLENVWKLTPALAAGNCVVLKAAPGTPYTALEIGRLIVERTKIPAGVVNILSSEDKSAVGEALTDNPRVDMFHFTGSTQTGTRIMQKAAIGVRKVALELGGKSANIILDDADLDVALSFQVGFGCLLSGQGCALPTRLLVPRSLRAEVEQRLAAMFAELTVGDPNEPATAIGPVSNATQRERIYGLIETGKAEGAKLLFGGDRISMKGDLTGGFWVQPTLFSDVDPSSTLAQTEIFGPVLSVIAYESDDDAVRIANSTAYGLAGYIQGKDIKRMKSIARRVRAGSIGINATVPFAHSDLPFGGYGQSGIGRENGIEGFEEYLQTKSLVMPA